MDAERERRLEEAGVTWDVLDAQWEENFALLVEYRDREGHCDVPKKHEERGAKLGTWLGTQRKARKKGVLDAEKERRLEEAGVTWDVLDAQWEENFEAAGGVGDREGTCDVPRNHEERGARAWHLAGHQRTARAKGRPGRRERAAARGGGRAFGIRSKRSGRKLEAAGGDVAPLGVQRSRLEAGSWLNKQRGRWRKQRTTRRERRLEDGGREWDGRRERDVGFPR